jgi:pimeloyl-ACP methyl ester carboxylesterase
LTGDRDLLVSEKSLQSLREGITGSELHRLVGLGHLAAIAQPERVAGEIVRFFNQAHS